MRVPTRKEERNKEMERKKERKGGRVGGREGKERKWQRKEHKSHGGIHVCDTSACSLEAPEAQGAGGDWRLYVHVCGLQLLSQAVKSGKLEDLRGKVRGQEPQRMLVSEWVGPSRFGT